MTTNTATTLAADDVAAVRDIPKRITEAWAGNDADAFAAVFTDDATMILPGSYAAGREEIRRFMAAAFAGPYRGTRVFGEPKSVRALGSDSAVVVTLGGVLAPGDEKVSDERAVHATWVVTKQGAEWLISAYQNSPAHAG
ncbi:MAG TPA: SgcJ/EcaC family oxidoreductase [Pseudonocardiaceae bacterium]|nr:SgcJ/EcaC family oxidoreductase [Pseudonocardiaceae bacterium]